MASRRKTVQKNEGARHPAGEPVPLELPADCRIAALPVLKDALSEALGTGLITLDGRQVERADTAALQLLVLFRRELTARGGSLGWIGASDALSEAARLLGLTQTLELPAIALA
jgi:phospholipid transport system transporter-binding protein